MHHRLSSLPRCTELGNRTRLATASHRDEILGVELPIEVGVADKRVGQANDPVLAIAEDDHSVVVDIEQVDVSVAS